MKFVYFVYVVGVSRPVWTYKTWRGLFLKLRELARHSGLAHVRVVYRERFSDSTQYDLGTAVERLVTFQRQEYGYGWQTPVGEGIRNGDLGCMSAWSHGSNVPLEYPAVAQAEAERQVEHDEAVADGSFRQAMIAAAEALPD